jgi:membrane protein implicated in regulation of membrane protease activity
MPMIGLIFKVLVLSTGLSIAIKYGAPALAMPPTTTAVLLAVWLPAAIAALMLGWRWQQGRGDQIGQ